MENYQWIFDGIGTTIISTILGLILGGTIGYKIGIHQRTNLNQTAGDNATQSQTGIINNYYGDKQK